MCTSDIVNSVMDSRLRLPSRLEEARPLRRVPESVRCVYLVAEEGAHGYSGRSAFVSMVQTTNLRNGDDAAGRPVPAVRDRLREYGEVDVSAV